MKGSHTKRSLSPPRQRLVELMQEVSFGRIEALRGVEGEPVLEPRPRVVRDFLLGKANTPNSACRKEDFVLKGPVVELFDLLERERAATVESLVVQHGLPVRLTVSDVARAA